MTHHQKVGYLKSEYVVVLFETKWYIWKKYNLVSICNRATLKWISMNLIHIYVYDGVMINHILNQKKVLNDLERLLNDEKM